MPRSVQQRGEDEVSAGTLYGALARLAEEGLLAVQRDEVVSGRRRRYYELTDEGRAVLFAEAERLQARAAVVQDFRTPSVPASVATS